MKYNRLIELAKEEWKISCFGTLFLLMSLGLNLTFPLIIGKLIDGIAQGGGQDVVNQYVLMLLGVFCSCWCCNLFRAYLFTVAGERIVTRLQQRLLHPYYNRKSHF